MRHLAALVLLFAPAAPAAAAELCNETSFVLETALGWRGSNGVIVEGWTRLRPGECVETGPDFDPESGETLYLYARSTAAYLGGIREWRGEAGLCVAETDFAVEGVRNCAALGMERRGFLALTGDSLRRATLMEPADFGTRAEEAGMQRLLQSAGYNIRVIDGLAGRRTQGEVARFVTDRGLPANLPRAEIIDALEATALQRNAEAGLIICNETGGPAAAAIARQRGDIWESRGWWRLQPGGCTRVLATRLEAADVFYYAERLTGAAHPPALNGGTERFCQAPSRFLAEGRSGCAQRGYTEAGFRRIPEPVDGTARIELRPADFATGGAP